MFSSNEYDYFSILNLGSAWIQTHTVQIMSLFL